MTESHEADFGITAQVKLKHADMLAAARKIGSAKALSELLEVPYVTVIEWIGMKAVPPNRARRFWPQERIDKLEKELFMLTGKLLDDLFPDELRNNIAMIATAVKFEQTKRLEAHLLTGMAQRATARLTCERPETTYDIAELREVLKEALTAFPERSAAILRYRFGLDGDGTRTLQECAEKFHVGRERIRQIEARMIRKLQQSPGSKLKAFADINTADEAIEASKTRRAAKYFADDESACP